MKDEGHSVRNIIGHLRRGDGGKCFAMPIYFSFFISSFILHPSSVPLKAQVGANFGKNKVEYKEFDWKFIQSPHFDVYYYQGGRELAEFTADHAEMALDSIERVVKYD